MAQHGLSHWYVYYVTILENLLVSLETFVLCFKGYIWVKRKQKSNRTERLDFSANLLS